MLTIKVNSTTFRDLADYGDYLALYQVDRAYSEDGLFFSRWKEGEARPYPACSSKSIKLMGMWKIAPINSPAAKTDNAVVEITKSADGVEAVWRA